MSSKIIWLLIGIVIGTNTGFLLSSLCRAAGRDQSFTEDNNKKKI